MRWPNYWSFSINPSSSQLTVFVVEMNGRKDGSREEWENVWEEGQGLKGNSDAKTDSWHQQQLPKGVF